LVFLFAFLAPSILTIARGTILWFNSVSIPKEILGFFYHNLSSLLDFVTVLLLFQEDAFEKPLIYSFSLVPLQELLADSVDLDKEAQSLVWICGIQTVHIV